MHTSCTLHDRSARFDWRDFFASRFFLHSLLAVCAVWERSQRPADSKRHTYDASRILCGLRSLSHCSPARCAPAVRCFCLLCLLQPPSAPPPSMADLSDDAGAASASAAAAAAALSASAASAAADAARISLLDVVIEEYSLESAARCSRFLLVSRIDPEKISVLQKFHADFLDAIEEQKRAAAVAGSAGGDAAAVPGSAAAATLKMTGVLFVLNGSTVLQLVEAPTATLVTLLRNLAAVSGWDTVPNASGSRGLTAAQAKAWNANGGEPLPLAPGSAAAILAAGSPASPAAGAAGSAGATGFVPIDPRYFPLLRNSRLLTFTEEVPREYGVWGFRSLKVPSACTGEEYLAGPDGASLSQSALKSCFEILRSLLELGRELSSFSEEKSLDFIQNSLSKTLLQKLPLPEKLQAMLLAGSGIEEELPTIPEWISLFDGAEGLDAGAGESEKVWPVEPFLKY